MTRARRAQQCLIRFHIPLPELSLVNIREAEFPILSRVIDSFEESLSLFFARNVEEYLDGPCTVSIEMALQIHDGAIASLPNIFLIAQLFRKSLAAENLRMHANNQHFLIVRTVENTNPPAFRKPERRTPQEIVFQFFGTRLLEA